MKKNRLKYELSTYVMLANGRLQMDKYEYSDRSKAFENRDWRNEMYRKLKEDGVIRGYEVRLWQRVVKEEQRESRI